MQRIDYGNQKATLDALPAADGSPGYYTDGDPPGTPPTTISAGHLNLIVEEICNFLADYVALDRADDEQIKTVMASRIKALRCASATAGPFTTDHLRAVIASGIATASGAGSVVAASTGSGTTSIVASGANSMIVAANGTNSDPVTVAGTESAAIGVADSTVDSNSARAAVIGSNNVHIGSGLSAVILGSGGSYSGGTQTVLGASSASTLDDSAEDSAILGTSGVVLAATSQSVALGSKNCELADDLTVGGGYNATGVTPSGSNQNLTWKIDSTTGNVYIDGAVSSPAADFAEYFERLTGHPEIEAGYFVALIVDPGQSGRMVAVKAGEGDTAVGIVPARPGIIGNSQALWGRVLQDPLGKPILDETGGYQPDPNAEPAKPTVLVSLLGQVRCYTTGGIVAGDRVVPTTFGVGRKAEPGEGGFLVLGTSTSDLDGPEHVATVLVR